MDLTPVKGMRDFLPEDAIRRERVVAVFKRVFERYGYNPLGTPAIENLEVLLNKYAEGADIAKETYKLSDQGGRELGLRYDLTVPLCRVVAANSNLALPFKRYQVERVWRDGPIKKGRYREFTQCDVDCLGVKGVQAEAEIAAMAADAFAELEMDAYLAVNNRVLLNALLDKAGVPKQKQEKAILSLDKLEKLGDEVVKEELIALGLKNAGKLLEEFAELDALGNEAFLERVKGLPGAKELREFIDLAEAAGTPSDFIQLRASLARGLNYYTGIVFEAFVRKGPVNSSVAGGGRYDELVASFCGRELPAVGISFGLDVLCEALEAGSLKSVARVLVAPIKINLSDAFGVARDFRSFGVNALVDLSARSPSKNANWAGKQGIPFVAFVGPQELESGKVKLKDLRSGSESLSSVADAAEKVKKSE